MVITQKRKKNGKTFAQPLRELVPSLCPKDRLFTIDDVFVLLQQSDPKRYFHRPSVRTQFTDMHSRGQIKRIRRAGSRLRITAQLAETRTGHSVWAERYDRQPAASPGIHAASRITNSRPATNQSL